GLRALRLQLVEDARQLADLPLVELELVGEEAQRPAHAERAAAEVVEAARLEPVAAVAVAAPAAVRPAALVSAGAVTVAGLRAAAAAVLPRLPPEHHPRVHVWTSSRRGVCAPDGVWGHVGMSLTCETTGNDAQDSCQPAARRYPRRRAQVETASA